MCVIASGTSPRCRNGSPGCSCGAEHPLRRVSPVEVLAPITFASWHRLRMCPPWGGPTVMVFLRPGLWRGYQDLCLHASSAMAPAAELGVVDVGGLVGHVA